MSFKDFNRKKYNENKHLSNYKELKVHICVENMVKVIDYFFSAEK